MHPGLLAQFWIRHLNAGGKLPEFAPNAAKETGGYEEFNRYVRALLVELGYADPWESQADAFDSGPRHQDDDEIFAGLREKFPQLPFDVASIGKLGDFDPVKELFLKDGKWDSSWASYILRNLEKRVVGDYKLVRLKRPDGSDKKVHNKTQYFFRHKDSAHETIASVVATKKEPGSTSFAWQKRGGYRGAHKGENAASRPNRLLKNSTYPKA